jgi:hypothetical protein
MRMFTAELGRKTMTLAGKAKSVLGFAPPSEHYDDC